MSLGAPPSWSAASATLLLALGLACGGESPPAAAKPGAVSPARAPATPELPPEPAPEPAPSNADDERQAGTDAIDALRPTPEETITHVVRPGEDPQMIAARYDEAPRWLRRWNRLEQGDKLKVGHRLSVRARRRPAPLEARSYTVREGDTVASVARRHGIPARTLGRLLRKKKDAALEVGRELELWTDPLQMAWLDGLPEDALGPGGLGGAFGVGAPDDGYLANAVAIPEHPDWELRFPHQSYGDSFAVAGAVMALHDFRARSGYKGPLRVWSMSRRYGGEIASHHSHRTGRDLDIKLPLRADLPATLAVKPEWVDYEATWHLIAALADTARVQEIFLDHTIAIEVELAAARLGVPEARRRELLSAPRPRLSKAGLVRHFDGHTDHVHVRFTCAPWATYCTDR